MTNLRSVVTLTAFVLALTAGSASAQNKVGRIIELTPTPLGQQMNLVGRVIFNSELSSPKEIMTFSVQEKNVVIPSTLDGHLLIVTVTTQTGTFDVMAATMQDTHGVIRLVSTELASPAFPLKGIRSISVKHGCEEVLFANL